MNMIYEHSSIITADRVTPSKTISVSAAAAYMQNSASLHSIEMGIDDVTLKEKYNAFWAVSRIIISLSKKACMNTPVNVRTWVTKCSHSRSERDCCIQSDGYIIAQGRCEWVMLDLDSRRPIRFPAELNPKQWIYPEEAADVPPFTKLVSEFAESDFVCERRIMPSDIDVSMHTNNAVYCRFLTDLFPTDFIMRQPFSSFEIRYIKESKEGQLLNFFRRDISPTESLLAAYDKEGNPVIAARAVFFFM